MSISASSDRCTVQLRSGAFCDRAAADGCPHPICWQHLRELTRWTQQMNWGMPADGRRLQNRGIPDGRPSWVYYALMPHGLVKIGYSANPLLRMTQLRVEPDAILALEPGDRRLERDRHSQFRDLVERRSEEFRPAQRLQDHVAAIVKEHGAPRDVLDRAGASIVESDGRTHLSPPPVGVEGHPL